jgi:hypothetical protein
MSENSLEMQLFELFKTVIEFLVTVCTYSYRPCHIYPMFKFCYAAIQQHYVQNCISKNNSALFNNAE